MDARTDDDEDEDVESGRAGDGPALLGHPLTADRINA